MLTWTRCLRTALWHVVVPDTRLPSARWFGLGTGPWADVYTLATRGRALTKAAPFGPTTVNCHKKDRNIRQLLILKIYDQYIIWTTVKMDFGSIRGKSPVPLHWQMHMKRIQNAQKNALHPLRTHCVRISYVLLIKHPYTVISSASFELHKTFWTGELSAIQCINLQHIRATNGVYPLSFVKVCDILNFRFLLAPLKLAYTAPENGESEER